MRKIILLVIASLLLFVQIKTVAQCNHWQQGEMLTYNQLNWGTPLSDAGTHLANEFGPLYFTTGGILEVGISGSGGQSITFSFASAVINYLPASGLAAPLSGDVVNPITSSSGVLGGEVVGLRLNVDFNDGGYVSGSSNTLFGDLVLTGLITLTSLNGATTRQVLAEAETILGGGASSLTATDINVLIQSLNDAFLTGTPSQFAQEHLRKGWQAGEMITLGHAAWGISPVNSLLMNDFGTVYFNSGGVVEVGIPGSGGFSIQFTGGAAIATFLLSIGNPAALTGDQVDPTTSSSGIFGGEVTTLQLNIDYNDASVLTGTSNILFGDLVLTGLTTLPYTGGSTASLSSFNGSTVRDVLATAETALGGGVVSTSFLDLLTLLQNINGAFEDGTPSQFAQEHLRKGWQQGDFETYVQSDWDGDSQALSLLFLNFSTLYAGTGLVVGDSSPGGITIRFDTPSDVVAYLPAGGSSGVLSASLVNPLTTSAGELAGQVVALKLNVDFEDAGLISSTQSVLFGDLVINNFSAVPSVNGMSVREFLDLANHILAGGSAAIGPSTTTAVASLLNDAFIDGIPSQFAKEHLISPCDVTNHCPVATAASVTTKVGTAINIQLQATDEDSDELTYSISQNASHGTVTTSASGGAIYTPTAGYYGADEFKFKADDGECESEAIVSVTVVVCPQIKGYWKNNPASWPVTSVTLGTVSYTRAQLITIFSTPVGTGNNADASLILADQLITAKLNIANGSPTSSALNNSIAAADALIGGSLIPMKVKPNSVLGKKMTSLAASLENFNKGALTTGCSVPAAKAGLELLVEDEMLQMPNDFALENYPNPFNGSTMIRYALPNTSTSYHVSLKIYDATGKEIKTLVNDEENPGWRTVRFDGSHLSAGIYFYRLTAGEFSDMRKMILVK